MIIIPFLIFFFFLVGGGYDETTFLDVNGILKIGIFPLLMLAATAANLTLLTLESSSDLLQGVSRKAEGREVFTQPLPSQIKYSNWVCSEAL